MTAAFSHKSSTEIRSRLTEIARLESLHAARDMDAELAEVMRKGGSIDALETAQLEAERDARRLRVERVALETELPLATAREGSAQIEVISGQYQELATGAAAHANKVVLAWKDFVSLVKGWNDIQSDAEKLTRRAASLSVSCEIEMPSLGTFRSRQLTQVGKEARSELLNGLLCAERELIVNAYSSKTCHSHLLDG